MLRRVELVWRRVCRSKRGQNPHHQCSSKDRMVEVSSDIKRSHRNSHEITQLFQASTHILVEEIFYHPPSRFITLCKLDPDNFCSKGEGLKIYMPNFPSCLPACLALNADVILSYFLHEITEFQECKNHIRDAWRL